MSSEDEDLFSSEENQPPNTYFDSFAYIPNSGISAETLLENLRVSKPQFLAQTFQPDVPLQEKDLHEIGSAGLVTFTSNLHYMNVNYRLKHLEDDRFMVSCWYSTDDSIRSLSAIYETDWEADQYPETALNCVHPNPDRFYMPYENIGIPKPKEIFKKIVGQSSVLPKFPSLDLNSYRTLEFFVHKSAFANLSTEACSTDRGRWIKSGEKGIQVHPKWERHGPFSEMDVNNGIWRKMPYDSQQSLVVLRIQKAKHPEYEITRLVAFFCLDVKGNKEIFGSKVFFHYQIDDAFKISKEGFEGESKRQRRTPVQMNFIRSFMGQRRPCEVHQVLKSMGIDDKRAVYNATRKKNDTHVGREAQFGKTVNNQKDLNALKPVSVGRNL